MNNSQKAYQLGQSIWYDNIQRRLLENGELAGMIKRGEVYGVTSNPSIFNNAIAKSNDYDDDLVPLVKAGKTAEEIFESLAVEDIRQAADLFRAVYVSTNGGDGYVSLEVSPDLANDTVVTCQEAQRLWDLVDRPNLMIKIPATKEGLSAITQSIQNGLNINVTLIFSVERYKEVMDAYLIGLESRVNEGKSIEGIASVASFFVSRIDSNVDNYLDELISSGSEHSELAKTMQGKVAIANAKMAYQEFRKVFESDRFSTLTEKGAQVQRPLWASTSTKNPTFLDVLYIDSLIGPNTVNTIPPKTLTAFIDHGLVGNTLGQNIDDAYKTLANLEVVGISLSRVTEKLEEEGVAAFSSAFRDLLDSVEARRLDVMR